MPENLERKYLVIQNNSDAIVFLFFNGSSALNTGMSLSAGQTYEMSPRFGNLNISSINAIHGGTGNKNLLITEG
jgi:hypothetical protein